MNTTLQERARLDDVQRIQRAREITANMRHTVELSGADLRVIRRALQRFATGSHGQRVTMEEAMDAQELVERLSSAEVPVQARA